MVGAEDRMERVVERLEGISRQLAVVNQRLEAVMATQLEMRTHSERITRLEEWRIVSADQYRRVWAALACLAGIIGVLVSAVAPHITWK